MGFRCVRRAHVPAKLAVGLDPGVEARLAHADMRQRRLDLSRSRRNAKPEGSIQARLRATRASHGGPRRTVGDAFGPVARRCPSALMSATWTTFSHFSVSAAMKFPNSAGVIDIGSTPTVDRRAFRLASVRTALISLPSLWVASAGVPVGAVMPYHWLAS